MAAMGRALRSSAALCHCAVRAGSPCVAPLSRSLRVSPRRSQPRLAVPFPCLYSPPKAVRFATLFATVRLEILRKSLIIRGGG
jgi:hypothetical protein